MWKEKIETNDLNAAEGRGPQNGQRDWNTSFQTFKPIVELLRGQCISAREKQAFLLLRGGAALGDGVAGLASRRRRVVQRFGGHTEKFELLFPFFVKRPDTLKGIWPSGVPTPRLFPPSFPL